jgi:CMP-N,N'-diacetyllegionaminic acid synthase
MTWDGHRVFALVPARGGSKGVPRKNLAALGGHTLIARAAAVARRLDWLDQAILSTDDEEMAEEGRAHGLTVPFMRPPELADDLSQAVDVWQHAWLELERRTGVTFSFSVLLEPSCPLRRPDDVTRTVAALVDGDHDAAATISPTPARFNAFKAVIPDERGVLHPAFGAAGQEMIRQLTPDHYHRNGACYAVRRSTLVDHGRVTERDCVGVPVEHTIVNIDEPLDLEIARLVHARDHGEDDADQPPMRVWSVPITAEPG